ncbi:roadblock/LC7 domain-containing protein [Demequina muriae]|uniref:Roadblock/LC7 domain-containing protein n=1 Tax=Demequina muriae TaxID=3051664 RepID=A0ABT8GK44_9MICO|nr:roadblock/LC7 domain-containing protein [Demequina sp. EGI L300058]MDN4481306.1 roadblock/LC7 domain-containing protein [Demequina sp. EGI L300058]
MIARDRCAHYAQELHAHPGVHRVIVAGHDGIAHYDDAALGAREQGAAAAATLVGVAGLVAQALGVDEAEGAVIYGASRQVITRSVDGELVLVVLAEAGERGNGVYRAVRRVAAALAEEAAARGSDDAPLKGPSTSA